MQSTYVKFAQLAACSLQAAIVDKQPPFFPLCLLIPSEPGRAGCRIFVQPTLKCYMEFSVRIVPPDPKNETEQQTTKSSWSTSSVPAIGSSKCPWRDQVFSSLR